MSGTHYLWVARLNNGAKLKVTDPKEQQGDVEEEEAKGKEGRDCRMGGNVKASTGLDSTTCTKR